MFLGFKEQYEWVGDVRGMGLMLGLEIVSAPHTPDGDRAGKLLKHCENNGMLMLRCGTQGQVVRWLPPLTVSEAEIEQAVALFDTALKET